MKIFEVQVVTSIEPFLSERGYHRVSTRADGFFDNLEIVYESCSFVLSVALSRGDVNVFFGVNNNHDVKLWPLEVLIEFIDPSYRAAIESSLSRHEYVEIGQQITRIGSLIQEWISQMERLFLSQNLTALYRKIEAHTYEVSRKNLEFLASCTTEKGEGEK